MDIQNELERTQKTPKETRTESARPITNENKKRKLKGGSLMDIGEKNLDETICKDLDSMIF